jgi:hypothetical protein
VSCWAYGPQGVSQEEWQAFAADMDAMSADLPTAAEVLDMARSLGLDDVPF